MTSSETGGCAMDLPAGTPEADLLAAGWQSCFVADEPRLSEAVEAYREIGYEVALLPVPAEDARCTECMREQPDRYRLIFIRPRKEG